jgi:hypothetical protein
VLGLFVADQHVGGTARRARHHLRQPGVFGRRQIGTADAGESLGAQAQHQEGQPVGVHGAVGVREGDDLAARRLDALVARHREPAVLVADEPELGVALRNRPGGVRGAVVDDDHLEVRVAQPPQRIEALLQGALRLVGADHHRDPGRGARRLRQLGAEDALEGAVGGLLLAIPAHQPEGPVLDREAARVPLVGEGEGDGACTAELGGDAGGARDDGRLGLLPLADGVDAELGEHEGAGAGQVLQTGEVAAQGDLVVQVDVETGEIQEVELQVLRGGEVGVGDERVGVHGVHLVRQLLQEALDARGPVPAHHLGRDLVAHQHRMQIGQLAQRTRRLADPPANLAAVPHGVEEADVLGPGHAHHQAQVEIRREIAEPRGGDVVQAQGVRAERMERGEIGLDDGLLGEGLAGGVGAEGPVGDATHEELVVRGKEHAGPADASHRSTPSLLACFTVPSKRLGSPRAMP